MVYLFLTVLACLLLAIVVLLARQQKWEVDQIALRASEERYRTLFDFTTDGVICHTSDGRVITANPAAQSILGLSQEEMQQYGDWDLWRKLSDAEGNPIAKTAIPCCVAIRDRRHVQDVIVGTPHGQSGAIVWLQFESIPILREGEAVPHQVIVVFMDVTQSRYMEDRFRAIVDASPNALLIVDEDDTVVLANQVCSVLFGHSQDELLGKPLQHLLPGDVLAAHGRKTLQAMRPSSEAGDEAPGELHIQHQDGALIPVEVGFRPITTLQGSFTLVTIVDVSERRAAQKEMSRLAYVDELTGLPNRRFFMDRLRHAMSSGARHHSLGALLFLDIDNFKTINDTQGHDTGDLLLEDVAHRLRATLRATDTIARIGGDEFVILLEDLGPKQSIAATYAREVGEKVLDQLSRPYLIRDRSTTSSVSIGVALWGGENSEDVSDLLKRSDMAMYSAKRDGKNAVHFFDPTMQKSLEQRMQLDVDLRTAISEQQLITYVQRRVDAQGNTVGAEMLLRWQHPQKGLVAPIDFIPAAEESGLIVSMGKWVLESACKQLCLWARSANTRALCLSVNVSAVEFKQDSFVANTIQTVRETGADPALLELEVTESMLFENVDACVAKMHALRDFGIRFSLDDFGTGYSSLSYLKSLPFNILKIDKSFVDDMETNANDATIVQVIIKMGQTLGLHVVAEGVESAAQLATLKHHGCALFQGYYFGRPEPIQVFESHLPPAA